MEPSICLLLLKFHEMMDIHVCVFMSVCLHPLNYRKARTHAIGRPES